MTTQTETTKTVRAAVVPQRVVLVLGGALTLLSMAWTAWSVVDLVGRAAPTPVAAAVAAGLELTWIALVALEWQQVHRTGRAPRSLAVAGWATAAVVVAVLALHGWLAHWSLIPLALMPLGAKALWHWALTGAAEEVRERQAEAARVAAEEQRRAEEEARRAAELDTGLTPEQQAELAALRRQAVYLEARAEAEARLAQARTAAEIRRAEVEADAERQREELHHALRREALRRAAELRMSAARTDADVLLQRVELERELRLSQPVLGLTVGIPAPAAEPGQEQAEPGRRFPDSDLDDPTVVDAAWQDITRRLDDDGEGGGLVVGGGTPGSGPATPADLGQDRAQNGVGGGTPGSGPATPADLGQDRAQNGVGGDTRERVWQAIRRYGPAVSTRALAEELELSRTTVKNHRDALARRGYPVYDR